MVINSDGHSYDLASNSKANTGVTLGIIGTALAALGGMNGNGSGFLNFGGGSSDFVRKETFDLAQMNAAKDSEIALLKSNAETDKKLVEVFNAINEKANAIREEMRANKDEQIAVNMQQGIYNATANANIAVLQSQVAGLQSLTKCVIPNGNVCPGWGNVTITPASTGTTTA